MRVLVAGTEGAAVTEFNGALDRYLDPPYESERDALDRERREEAFLADTRGEQCRKCGGKTEVSVDNGKGWVLCQDERCEHQRTEAL
jgi:hypothetical protein